MVEFVTLRFVDLFIQLLFLLSLVECWGIDFQESKKFLPKRFSKINFSNQDKKYENIFPNNCPNHSVSISLKKK